MTQPTINTQLIDSLVQSILSLSESEIELFIAKLNSSISPEENTKHKALKQDLEIGLQQLHGGQYKTYASDDLPSLIDTIKQRGKQRLV